MKCPVSPYPVGLLLNGHRNSPIRFLIAVHPFQDPPFSQEEPYPSLFFSISTIFLYIHASITEFHIPHFLGISFFIRVSEARSSLSMETKLFIPSGLHFVVLDLFFRNGVRRRVHATPPRFYLPFLRVELSFTPFFLFRTGEVKDSCRPRADCRPSVTFFRMSLLFYSLTCCFPPFFYVS